MEMNNLLKGPQQILLIKKNHKAWQRLFMFIKPKPYVLT